MWHLGGIQLPISYPIELGGPPGWVEVSKGCDGTPAIGKVCGISMLHTSVGEVRSGLVLGHFCQTGDQTVRSLMKYLGPGPGTAMNCLYRSGPGPDRVQTVPALFIYLFIQD